MWAQRRGSTMARMTDTATLDPADVEQFAGQLMSIYTGSMLNYMIDIGHRTGLFTAAARGPATSQDLAGRAGLTERYVREWLGAMVTSRIFTMTRRLRAMPCLPRTPPCSPTGE